jgi:hypothetical protein
MDSHRSTRLVITAIALFVLTVRVHAADDGVTMYRDDGFRGQSIFVPVDRDVVNLDDDRDEIIKKAAGGIEDAVSSIRWTIPKGKCLVIYNDDNFVEPVLILIGKGQIANLNDDYAKVHDSASSVEWQNYPPTPFKKVPIAGEITKTKGRKKPKR